MPLYDFFRKKPRMVAEDHASDLSKTLSPGLANQSAASKPTAERIEKILFDADEFADEFPDGFAGNAVKAQRARRYVQRLGSKKLSEFANKVPVELPVLSKLEKRSTETIGPTAEQTRETFLKRVEKHGLVSAIEFEARALQDRKVESFIADVTHQGVTSAIQNTQKRMMDSGFARTLTERQSTLRAKQYNDKKYVYGDAIAARLVLEAMQSHNYRDDKIVGVKEIAANFVANGSNDLAAELALVMIDSHHDSLQANDLNQSYRRQQNTPARGGLNERNRGGGLGD